MWRVKTVTKFKNSFFPVLIYWNNNRIHLNILEARFGPPLISISGHRDDDRFCGLMVYLSMHSNSGQQDVEIKKPASISLSRDGVHGTMKVRTQ